MKRTESGEKKANRQCWECLKRRLVCDHTLPHCKKCKKTGKTCPGYDAQKPLQWVEPGKVTSRRRKKDASPKVYTIKPKGEGMTAQPELDLAADSAAGPTTIDFLDVVTQDDTTDIDWIGLEDPRPSSEAIEIYQNQLASLLIHEDNSEWWTSLTSEGQMEYVVRKARQTLAGVGVAERLLLIGNQNKLRQLVHRGREREAAVLLNTTRKPLDRLKELLWVMEKNYIPSYDLCNDTSEVVQAVDYCTFIPSFEIPI